MDRRAKAVDMFTTSHNCAQSVATAFAADTGLGEDLSCRMACAFGGGGGRRQYCCGAVSGALLTISLLRGRGLAGEKSEQEAAYTLAREFYARFEALHGSPECRVLLDRVNLLTAEGQARFKAEGMSARCAGFVGDAVEIVEELLELK